MPEFLQINLNHCWAAQQLMAQTAMELRSDIIIISEQYNNPSDDELWSRSTDGRCAVAIKRTSDLVVEDNGFGAGFTWLWAGGLQVYSCYCTPRWSDGKFTNFLGDLESSISTHGQLEAVLVLVVGGDFNAHSAEWGSATEDVRGGLLSDFAVGMGLVPCNIGTVSTYSRVNAQSVVDATFAYLAMGVAVSGWRVLADYNLESDHRYITYSVASPNSAAPGSANSRPVPAKRWVVRKLDMTKFSLMLSPKPAFDENISPIELAEFLQDFSTRICNYSMPRLAAFSGRRSAHWWTD